MAPPTQTLMRYPALTLGMKDAAVRFSFNLAAPRTAT